MSERAYTCALCGGTFEPEWSEDEAQAEYVRVFDAVDPDPAVVCDDCYQLITLQHLPPAA